MAYEAYTIFKCLTQRSRLALRNKRLDITIGPKVRRGYHNWHHECNGRGHFLRHTKLKQWQFLVLTLPLQWA
ncbi:unnamed protein product [Rhizophagus irregularis]|nr:unnamed protein product [Rhizophagus irregularis]